jgi:hypothetical protein
VKVEKDSSFIQIAINKYISKNSTLEMPASAMSYKENEMVKHNKHFVYSHNKDISHKNLNEHHFGRSNSTPIRDEDLDIDELLATSNYIYLEQHHDLDTYNH